MKRHYWIAGAAVLPVLAGGVAGGRALLSEAGTEATGGPPTAVSLPGPPPGATGHGGRGPSQGSASEGTARAVREPAAQRADRSAADRPASGRAAADRPVPGEAIPNANRRARQGPARRGQPIVWLRRGARVALRAGPRGRVVGRLRWRTRFGSRTVLAAFATRGGWAGVPTPLLPNGRLGWVRLDPSRLRRGWTRYSIEVDLSARAARLRLDGRTLRSFPVTIGSPASPTPTGRFALTDTFRGQLNPAYGCCALATTATQPDLPSGWLGGNRIAIHGTSGPLGVAASHGCIRAADEDVSALVDRVGPGTPVVVRR